MGDKENKWYFQLGGQGARREGMQSRLGEPIERWVSLFRRIVAPLLGFRRKLEPEVSVLEAKVLC